MGTIEDMDKEYKNAIESGKLLDELYLNHFNKMHLCKREINDVKNRYIAKALIYLYISFLLSFGLGGFYYLQDLQIIDAIMDKIITALTRGN
jgi:hypothetical protein